MQQWSWLAICIVGWGLGVFLMKIAATRIGPTTAVVFNLPGYLLAAAWLIPQARWKVSVGHLAAVAVGACFVAANLAFYRLLETGPVARLSALAGLYVVVPVVLGAVLLREQPRAVHWAGIVLAMAALVLLSWPASTRGSP